MVGKLLVPLLTRPQLAWAGVLLPVQGLVLCGDLVAGPRAALGVLAVVALLPAGRLVDARQAVLVMLVFVSGRVIDYALGGNTGLTTLAEIGSGAIAMVAARAAASSVRGARARLAKEASHDLRTPLTVLHGYLSMLEDGSLPPDRARHVAALLGKKTRELNERIDNVVERIR
jgi:signal transduction histidine kinase